MNKLYTFFLAAFLLVGCTGNDTEKANALLSEARSAVADNKFDEARSLIDSLRNAYPKEIEVRKAALVFMDTLELQNAKQDYQVSDSIYTYKQFELDDLKKQFVFEKQEKYQTTGYYVTPDYAGSKAGFNYFTEVEEGGALLAVTINRSAGIKYDFTTVPISADSSTVSVCPISRSLTPKEQASYEKCYRLAQCMQMYSLAKAEREKLSLKIRFFAKKIEKDKDVLAGE